MGGWVGVEGLKLTEMANVPDPDAGEEEASAKALLPAVTMREMVIVHGNAPLDSEIGLRRLINTRGGCFKLERESVQVRVEFKEETDQRKLEYYEGLHVRVHELKRILRRWEELHWSKGSDGKREADEEGTEEKRQERPSNSTTSGRPTPSSNPLSYVQSLSFSLPLFVLSAHYSTPSTVVATAGNRPLPESVAFALTLRGLQGNVVLGGTTDTEDVGDHKRWLGKGTDLKVRAGMRWKEIEGRVKVNGDRGECVHCSTKEKFNSRFLFMQRTSCPSPRKLSPLDLRLSP